MKKALKIISVILIAIIVLLIGRKVYYSNIEIKPNDVYLKSEISGENIKMNMGSYSWQDKGINVVADSISAQNIENLKTLEVKQNEKIYFTHCNWNKATARLLLVNEDDVIGVSVEVNVNENYIIVPHFEGEYIIQLDLSSDKGNVWYASKLNIVK